MLRFVSLGFLVAVMGVNVLRSFIMHDVRGVYHTARHYPVEPLFDDWPVRWVYEVFGFLTGGRQFV